MIDLTLAPGCFGSALTYKPGTAECDTCPFNDQCAVAHAERLVALREALGLAPVKKAASRKPAEKPKPAVPVASLATPMMPTVPVKVRALLERIHRAGIKVHEARRTGENPFREGFKFMRVAWHLLQKNPHGVTRTHLMMAMMKAFNWSEGTAGAHATQAKQALIALGVCEDLNGLTKFKDS